jgi:hypothetical protein
MRIRLWYSGYELCEAWQKGVSVLEEPASSMFRIDKETRERSYPEDGGNRPPFYLSTKPHEITNVHIVPLFAY